ncbi:MAG TPA: LamG domain-containing protein, partial [Panacibacter sp.]|nr:LamG domain-containing protein [Panacibacter sp.]
MKKNTLFCSLLFMFLTASLSCKKDADISTVSTNASGDQLETGIVIADSSLLCYLPFKGNLADKSGHGNNGVLNGTVSYVPDRFGNASGAVSFSASNAWIEIPETAFVGLGRATIAMDFYPSSANQQVILSKMSYSAPIGSAGFYQSFVVSLGGDGIIDFDIRKEGYCNASDGSGWNPNLYSNSPFIYNAWNHLAITYKDNVEKIYVNGVLAGISIKTASPICQGEPIRLGVWWQADPQYYTGNLDEVRIYNRILSGK